MVKNVIVFEIHHGIILFLTHVWYDKIFEKNNNPLCLFLEKNT